jgi:RNA polymerase sigma-70 factor (ECF subfamily)
MASPEDEMIPTRATLLQRLKNWQDQASWEDFFETYRKLIHRVAIKGGLTEAEAEDAVQETMKAVAKHMPEFEYDPAIGSFKAWLLNMTRWRISDQLEKRRRTVGVEATSDEVENQIDPSTHNLEALWDSEWKKHMIERAVRRIRRGLEPEKYQIYDFCVNKEWPPEKVATAFGVSVEQVYLAKHRIVELIKVEVARLEKQEN